ncbi:hypothetical protein BP5796_11296 [Coleophoma crateriformis]|uniref:Uncharacterized protein n=1 Tax=Coleophoma crateriformis TaxID=565419 RepID=A0A3D8QIZ0_9HELO|nr:hypothetical protein BP5796_11296 [Coleophoma crateriformis]
MPSISSHTLRSLPASISPAVIASIIAGSVILLIIITALALFVYRRRRQSERQYRQGRRNAISAESPLMALPSRNAPPALSLHEVREIYSRENFSLPSSINSSTFNLVSASGSFANDASRNHGAYELDIEPPSSAAGSSYHPRAYPLHSSANSRHSQYPSLNTWRSSNPPIPLHPTQTRIIVTPPTPISPIRRISDSFAWFTTSLVGKKIKGEVNVEVIVPEEGEMEGERGRKIVRRGGVWGLRSVSEEGDDEEEMSMVLNASALAEGEDEKEDPDEALDFTHSDLDRLPLARPRSHIETQNEDAGFDAELDDDYASRLQQISLHSFLASTRESTPGIVEP